MIRFAALFALVLLAPPALAQAPDFTALVRNVAGAVVNLSGSLRPVLPDLPLAEDEGADDRRDLWRHFGPPPELRRLGSGFVIDESGYIITNAHLVENAEQQVGISGPSAFRGAQLLAMALLASRMLQDKVAQHELQRELAQAVAARASGCDVIADHGFDIELAFGGAREVVAELRRRDFRDVLVVRDRQHLLFREVAQREAVFEAKHLR